MLVQVLWAMLVLLFFQGFFDKIITFVTFMDIVFMGLAGAAVFVLRKKRKDLPRPIKAWGYPLIPLFFVGISAAFAVNTLLERPEQALPGLGIFVVGIGVYFGFKKS
jgi:basic amino acid/polyamine antiporter, APA family